MKTIYNQQTRITKRELLAAGTIIGLGLCLQLYFSLQIPFDPDELAHLHQAFLYREGLKPFVDYIVEKPPFLSFLLAKVTYFLGYDTLWFYRIPFILIGIGISISTYWLSRRLIGAWGALAAVFILNSTTIYRVVTMSIRPDGMLSLCLVIAFILLSCWQQQGKRRYVIAAGFFGGLAVVAKLMPLPVVIIMGVWVLSQNFSLNTAFRVETWRNVFLFFIGLGISGILFVSLFPWNVFKGLVYIPKLLSEIWIKAQPNIFDVSSSTVPEYISHEPMFFSLSILAVLVILFQKRKFFQGEILALIGISFFLYMPVVYMKRSSHIQDLLALVVFGSILSGALAEWGLEKLKNFHSWKMLFFPLMALIFIIESVVSGRWLIETERWPIQENSFIIQAQVEKCSGNPMTVDQFIGCFREPLLTSVEHVRLSLGQQTAAVRFLNRAIGHEGNALSSISLNVFTHNSRSFSPPRLHLFYYALPIVYKLLAQNQMPCSKKILSEMFHQSGHQHVLLPSTGGLAENLYHELAIDHPPEVVQLDDTTIQVYVEHPKLYQYLQEHYQVVFDVKSAGFFACHRSLTLQACQQALDRPGESPAAKLVLKSIQQIASQSFLEAEDTLRQALSIAPKHPEANYRMGRLARTRGDLEMAVSHLSIANRESRGHDLDAIVEWAEILYELGEKERAKSLCENIQQYFVWDDGHWRGLQPYGLLFSRNPEELVVRYTTLARKLA